MVTRAADLRAVSPPLALEITDELFRAVFSPARTSPPVRKTALFLFLVVGLRVSFGIAMKPDRAEPRALSAPPRLSEAVISE